MRDGHEVEDGFYHMVLKMRDAQNNYYKSRSVEWLRRAKDLERKVDRAIVDHKELMNGQKELF